MSDPAGRTSDRTPGAAEAERPLLRVVRGSATEEELAALVAVVAALGSGGGEPPAAPRSLWASPAARLRRPQLPGPGAWRASALPR